MKGIIIGKQGSGKSEMIPFFDKYNIRHNYLKEEVDADLAFEMNNTIYMDYLLEKCKFCTTNNFEECNVILVNPKQFCDIPKNHLSSIDFFVWLDLNKIKRVANETFQRDSFNFDLFDIVEQHQSLYDNHFTDLLYSLGKPILYENTNEKIDLLATNIISILKFPELLGYYKDIYC